MEFDWDEANEEHIARHGISRVEAETVLVDPLAGYVGSQIVDGELRFRQIGTAAGGRILVVAFTLRGEVVRPITAFEAHPAAVRRYKRGLYH